MTLTTIEDTLKISAFGGDDTDETGADEIEEKDDLGLEEEDADEESEDKELEEELDEDEDTTEEE